MALSGNEIAILIKARDEASGTMDHVQGKAKGLSNMLGTALKAGAVAGGAALAGAGVAALKMGMDFEKTMAEVKTLMPDISEKAFGKMKDDVLDFSKEMGIATDQAVPALYQAISAGVPKENVMEFMTVASKAAIGGVTDLETAVDGITSVINAYGVENISAAKAADVMFTGVRLGKTTFEELSASLYNVVPMASAAGISFEEVTAALASLTAQGVPTAQATTQLRAAIQALAAPTEAQSKLMEELGLDFSASRLESIGLVGAFDELNTATGGNMEQMRKLVGSTEALMAILGLSGEQAAAFKDAIAEAEEATGGLDQAFETVSETTSYKLNKAINEMKVEMITVGVKVLPLLVAGLEKIRPIIVPLAGAIVALVAAWATWKIVSLVSQIGTLVTALRSMNLALLGPAGIVAALAIGAFALGKFIDKNRDAIDKMPVLGGLVRANARYQRELNEALADANDLYRRQLLTVDQLAFRTLKALGKSLKTLTDEYNEQGKKVGPWGRLNEVAWESYLDIVTDTVKEMQAQGADLEQIYDALERAGIDWKNTTIEDALRPMERAAKEALGEQGVGGEIGKLLRRYEDDTPKMIAATQDLAAANEESFAAIKGTIKGLLPTIDEEFDAWEERLTTLFAAQVAFEGNLRELYTVLATAQVENVGDIVRTVEEGGPLAAQAAINMLREGTMGLETYRLLGEHITVVEDYTGDVVDAIENERETVGLEMVAFAEAMIDAFSLTLFGPKTQEAVGAINYMTEEMKKALHGSPQYKTWHWGIEMAEDLVTGFVNGIAAKKTSGIVAILALIKELYDALHASPQYLTWHWGKAMAQDLSHGWQQGLESLTTPSVASLSLPAATSSYAPVGAAAGGSGGSVSPIHIEFSGPLLGDQRQLEEIAERLEPVLRRRFG